MCIYIYIYIYIYTSPKCIHKCIYIYVYIYIPRLNVSINVLLILSLFVADMVVREGLS